MLPGLELSGILQVLPLVNIVLMTRDLFNGTVEPLTAVVVLVTTLLYALMALSLAAQVFGSEAVLYSEQSSWSDLLRHPDEPQPAAAMAAVLWCLALMVPIQFCCMAAVRMIPSIDPVGAIVLGVGINLLLFGLLPAPFLWLGRVDLVGGLGLVTPRPAAWLAAILLGGALWPPELYLISRSELAATLAERVGPEMERLAKPATASAGASWRSSSCRRSWRRYFSGVCYSEVLQRCCGPWLTIGVSGVLFGATHIVLGGALGLERLVPTTLLGLILGVVRCAHGESLALHHPACMPQRHPDDRGIERPRFDRSHPVGMACWRRVRASAAAWLLWQWGKAEASGNPAIPALASRAP